MLVKKSTISLMIAASLSGAFSVHADNNEHENSRIKQVLLISVDGLHAIDLENYIKDPKHAGSAFSELSSHGVRYTNASTSKPSDSFPGILSIVTGGSPISTGVFYDVSWDRSQYDPKDTQCQGEPGIQTTYDETLDLIDAKGNSLDKIDVSLLPNAKNADGQCVRIWPHDFVKTNTIFEVIKRSGHRTAWADKHPAYDLVNGPSGKGVDDLYTPEITNPVGFDATVSVVCTHDNDNKKVSAVINEINGFDHTGKNHVGTPAIFGMNFQAVSVGQKLSIDNRDGSCTLADPAKLYGTKGGYLDGAATPSALLKYSLEQTDASLRQIINTLKSRGLYNSTLVVLTAKHGQAPIDPLKTNKPGHLLDLIAALPTSGDAGAQAILNAGENEDDVAMIWLKDQSQTEVAAKYLRDNGAALNIQEVLAGESLKLQFNDPLKENRTPDIIVVPNYGTIFTTSVKKNAEHGGFSDADTNVALLISNPALSKQLIKTPVTTTQIAPTILQALGLNPELLEAVRKEHTSVLSEFREK